MSGFGVVLVFRQQSGYGVAVRMAARSDAKKVAKQLKSFGLYIRFRGTCSSMLLRTSFGATPLFPFFWDFGVP